MPAPKFADVMDVRCFRRRAPDAGLNFVKRRRRRNSPPNALKAQSAPCAAFTCAVGKSRLQRELKKPGVGDDKDRMRELLLEVERVSRALRDPSLPKKA